MRHTEGLIPTNNSLQFKIIYSEIWNNSMKDSHKKYRCKDINYQTAIE